MSLATRSLAATAALALGLSVAASGAHGQSPSMPSTQRYGTGLLDIPVSSVLRHGTGVVTYSGFFTRLDRTLQVDGAGTPVGLGPGANAFHWDLSGAWGIYDRGEAGVSVQSWKGGDSGGKVLGVFGRLRLWQPIDQGLGLAVGGRYLTSPDFGDGVKREPGRLGIADPRLTSQSMGSTNLTLYGVATAYLRGFDGGPLPENDMTFTLGYGTGMFKEGADSPLYGAGANNGWFYGASLNVATSDRSIVTVMAEHNGFDVNVGAQLDWDGLRLGVNWLASNHAAPAGIHYSEYHQGKFGFLGSVAICPLSPGFRCRPRMMRRTEPDTVFIPPPPPDTVVVTSTVRATPVGDPVEVCLGTGQEVTLIVTAAGDTLVGPEGVPLRSVRPVLDFAGSYAAGAFWYESGQVIVFEGADYGRAPDTFTVDCDEIVRVGMYQGVPVFADRSAYRPLVMLFLPERLGVWRRYERGLR